MKKNSIRFSEEYLQALKLKHYSEPTIKTYGLHFQRFLNFYPEIELENIKQEQIRKYLLFLVEEKHYSTYSQNNAINAIKFYFRDVKKYYFDIPKNKERKFPVVLSKEDVKKIINCTNNLKHKTILSTIYPVGL
ncbi:MAG: site-specific integrase [Candidatus Cloacimonadota bacterium]|nr:site-specific integrase [Candidatus Cloacimonadota bacterium]